MSSIYTIYTLKFDKIFIILYYIVELTKIYKGVTYVPIRFIGDLIDYGLYQININMDYGEGVYKTTRKNMLNCL